MFDIKEFLLRLLFKVVGLGSVDKRASTNLLQYFGEEEKNIVTRRMRHVTHDN